MPKIPSVGDGALGPRAAAQAPRGIASYRPVVGDGNAAGLANAGAALKGLARTGMASLHEADKIEVATAQSAFSRAKIEIDEEFANDQGDPSTMKVRWADAMNAAKKDALSAVRNQRYQDLLNQEFMVDVARGAAVIEGRLRGLDRDKALADLDETLAANRQAALLATDPNDQARLINASSLAITGAAERGYITEQEAVKARMGWRESFALGHLEMQTPADRLRLIEEEPDFAKVVPADKLARIRARAEKELEAEQREASAYAVSDLEIAVRRGERGVDAIEQAFGAGWLEPTKRTQLTAIADDVAKKRHKEDEEIGRVAVAAAVGLPLDPGNDKDRKAVDLHFERVFLPALGKVEPDRQAEAMLGYVRDTGVVPSPLKLKWTSVLRGADPAAKAMVGDVMARLDEITPRLLENFDTDDRRLGAAIASNLRIGLEPPQAVKRAQDRLFNADDPARKVRAERLRSDKLLANAESVVADALAEPRLFSMDFGDAAVPDAVIGEYRVAYQGHYLATGDADAAKALALGDLKRTWAVSRVGGERRLMKYAPERFGVPTISDAENAEWMQGQLDADLSALGISAEGIRLEVDPVTARQGVPSYVVLRARDDGAVETLTRPDGQPLRWRPDWATSPYRAEIEAETAATVDKARKKRARMVERPDLANPERSRAKGVRDGASHDNDRFDRMRDRIEQAGMGK